MSMPELERLAPDVQIINLSFTDEWIVVTYVEKSDVTPTVVDTITREFRRNVDPEFEEDIELILENARSLVDKGAVAKRNPPPSFTRGR